MPACIGRVGPCWDAQGAAKVDAVEVREQYCFVLEVVLMEPLNRWLLGLHPTLHLEHARVCMGIWSRYVSNL